MYKVDIFCARNVWCTKREWLIAVFHTRTSLGASVTRIKMLAIRKFAHFQLIVARRVKTCSRGNQSAPTTQLFLYQGRSLAAATPPAATRPSATVTITISRCTRRRFPTRHVNCIQISASLCHPTVRTTTEKIASPSPLFQRNFSGPWTLKTRVALSKVALSKVALSKVALTASLSLRLTPNSEMATLEVLPCCWRRKDCGRISYAWETK